MHIHMMGLSVAGRVALEHPPAPPHASERPHSHASPSSDEWGESDRPGIFNIGPHPPPPTCPQKNIHHNVPLTRGNVLVKKDLHSRGLHIPVAIPSLHIEG